ncbi:MAG: hypothetical protein QNJ41_01320 [Xenococcaceae cyanobacterium MO_188.B32]|nr:hypothetical protein [Xenococcaceae cyanobacterium MO_188.B32]
MKKDSFHWGLFFGVIFLGAILRFTNLASKPPWSDEWATLVFSLGHSFRTVPLDSVISLDTLLSPLLWDNTTQPQDVINNLLTESTHPPLYFVLNHWWLELFPQSQGLVSIWWGRAFSALWGIVSIPAMFGLGWLFSGSFIVAQMSAALMAVSPYGVYLSQEARHYTLAILFVIASLACLLLAIRCIHRQIAFPLWIVFCWIVINSLGVATHYFFSLALVTETIVLLDFWIAELKHKKSNIWAIYWSRIYLAMVGTFIGCSVWIMNWYSIRDNQLTDWIFDNNPVEKFFEPISRVLVWIITMVFLLPVEGTPEWISIFSGAIIVLVIAWLMFSWIKSFKACSQIYATNLGILILSRFLVSAIAIILTITYIFGADLTLSARFQFIYFPVVILLLGIIMAYLWQEAKLFRKKKVTNIIQEISQEFPPEERANLTQLTYNSGYKYWLWFRPKGKKVIYLTLLIGILGALTVVTNFAYQKVERPDVVVPVMVEAHHKVASKTPVLITTLHKTHGQTGEMMSLAWQFQKLLNQDKLNFQPQFLLAHNDREDRLVATQVLYKQLSKMPRPFQLWVVNFSAPIQLETQNCTTQEEHEYRATGYRYRMYSCFDVLH